MLIKPLKIGNVKLKNNILLAPMAGFSDVGFRSLAYVFGIGLACTEMVSAKALLFDNDKTKDLLITNSNESPKAVQIFGNDPEVFSKVISSGILDKFDIIDINMGCPAPKIVNNHEGSWLMTNLDLAEKIIKAAVSSTTKPVTVKFRAGFFKENKNAVEFAKMCERAGASAITIHGRTREDYYSGQVDKEIIKQCVLSVKIPVIANGDITTPKKAFDLLSYTNAAGIMIGRGALGNLDLISSLSNTKVKMTKFEQINFIANLLKLHYNEKHVLNKLRAHLVHFVKGKTFSTKIKQELLKIENTDELLQKLKIYLDYWINAKLDI